MLSRLTYLCLAVSACGDTAPTVPATTIAMSFARTGFYDAPFPSDDLLTADGHVDLSRVPDPNHVTLFQQAMGLLSSAHGFAQSGAIYFQATDAIDPTSLPDIAGSVMPTSSVFVISVDPKAPDFMQRHPLDVAYLDDGGPFGSPHMIAALPVQGLPLNPHEIYAAVVTVAVKDVNGHSVVPSNDMLALQADETPRIPPFNDIASINYRAALSALTTSGMNIHSVVGMAVFTTGTPTAELDTVRADILSRALPTLPAPTQSDVFPDYCVYNSMISMPVYQAGTPPYMSHGGAWAFDANGKPLVDHMEMARVVFTVPRKVVPPAGAGFPLVVFVRTGGGGDRPLVDRGVCATPDFTVPVTPGSGPAQDLARVGFAGVQVDGPLGGIRNTTMGDEQFLVFNVLNPSALRDNVRQSAVELILLEHAVAGMTFDTSDCPGAPAKTTFDTNHVALMGHSMGAWIAPLAVAAEPNFGATILSGAGGSYIANIMDKINPTRVRPFAEALLDYDMDGRSLERHDPALTYLQWAAEPSDPQVYDARIVTSPPTGTAPRHVLMEQGIVDHYILPSIANATSLALGLDEAGTAFDATSAEEMKLMQTPLTTLLPLAGRHAITLPVTGNVTAGKTTAVVIQHPSDGIEDGHEVIFQTAAPKHQYRCLLASWLRGVPTIPADGAEDDPCP